MKEIEELVKNELRKTLQKYLINKLTYEILNNESYDDKTIATKEDIGNADNEVDDGPINDNDQRIIRYVEYLSKSESDPDSNVESNEDNVEGSNEDDVEGSNEDDEEGYCVDKERSSDDEEQSNGCMGGCTDETDHYNHSVFRDPSNLSYLLDYCEGDGLGWLVKEFTEDLFDSDDTILDVISSTDENFDREIGEFLFNSWDRNYDNAEIDNDESRWLAKVYRDAMVTFLSKFTFVEFKEFIMKTILGQEQVNKMIMEPLNDFKTSIESYNQAYNDYDLLEMQNSWYIFAQQQIDQGRKKPSSKAKLNSIIVDKAKKTFVSIFPAVLNHLYYSDENQQSTGIINHPSLFNVQNRFAKLSELGKSVSKNMIENSSNNFKATNVVVAELVFIGKTNGDAKNVEFLNIPIAFDSSIKLISRDIDDGIIQDELGYMTQIRNDNAAAQKCFAGGDINVPDINEGMLLKLFSF